TVKLIEALKQYYAAQPSTPTKSDEPKKAPAPRNSSGTKTKKIKRSTFEIPSDVDGPKELTESEEPIKSQKRKRNSSSDEPESSPVQTDSTQPIKKRKTRSPKNDVCKTTEKSPMRKSPTNHSKPSQATPPKPVVDSDMKAIIMAELDKKVQERKSVLSQSTGKIPRFAAFAARNRDSKPITPGNKDWNKIHSKGFDKMEGIDQYLERKRQRMESLSASTKKAKKIVDEAKNAAENLKAVKTPKSAFKNVRIAKSVGRMKSPGNFLKSPRPVVVKPKTSNLKTPIKPVLPPILTTSKTPTVKKSVHLTVPTTAPKLARKSVGVERKSLGNRVIQLNTTLTPKPKKTVFDLQASLHKPLSYRPYTGKLKPLCENSSNKVIRPNLEKAKQEIKKPKLQTRDDRRNAHTLHRKTMKANNMMARRGITS
ncbi:nucleolar and spindle-associated protein 1-B-like, partial [Saccoglossus kowalevskii]|uniref:Nucleolar and spindle-associated protein 1-like n=1 Tax=Saccoglossus kowalevskii TaxID=10224 RepID=A0ABM0GT36_SACKO